MRWPGLMAVLIGLLLFGVTAESVMASQVVVDSDYAYGTSGIMKLSGALYRNTEDSDSNHDYYAVKVTVTDVKYRNNGWVGPLYLYVDIGVLPTTAIEVPENHRPQAGIVLSQNSVSFSYEGIGFNVYIPRAFISYYEKTDSLHHFIWEVSGTKPSWVGWWFVFDDYAEFAVGFRVPQNSQVATATYAYGEWYKFYGAVFKKVGTDSAVIGMDNNPTSRYLAKDALQRLKKKNKDILKLPEVIKASDETLKLIGGSQMPGMR